MTILNVLLKAGIFCKMLSHSITISYVYKDYLWVKGIISYANISFPYFRSDYGIRQLSKCI